MIFKCYNIGSYLEELGECTLPEGVMPKIGEQHYFGDQLYMLVEFRVRKGRSTMYFTKYFIPPIATGGLGCSAKPVV